MKSSVLGWNLEFGTFLIQQFPHLISRTLNAAKEQEKENYLLKGFLGENSPTYQISRFCEKKVIKAAFYFFYLIFFFFV